MNLKVRLFGAFRNYADTPEVECALPSHATQATLKMELERLLSATHHSHAGPDEQRSRLSRLLAESALADEEKVLSETDPLRDGMRLAILPPVCGG
jgi:molybdopterin converting factor small subunit